MDTGISSHMRGPTMSLCLSFADMIGCYKDDKTLDDDFRLINARALEYQVEQFSTKQDCIDQCGDKGFLYAGFQNGDLCFCGNTYDKYGRADDTDCNIKCRNPEEQAEFTDNEFESCGGRWRNAVYAGELKIIFARRENRKRHGGLNPLNVNFDILGILNEQDTLLSAQVYKWVAVNY